MGSGQLPAVASEQEVARFNPRLPQGLGFAYSPCSYVGFLVSHTITKHACLGLIHRSVHHPVTPLLLKDGLRTCFTAFQLV